MIVEGHLYGGAGVAKVYQASETMSTVGVPVEAAAAATTDIGSVALFNASASSSPLAGITLDATGTVSATADQADIEVTVDVRPDAVIHAKMSGGASEDTSLSLNATTSAQADGTSANGVTTLDDSAIWGYDGANAGVLRRADDTSGSVAISFDNAIASGDNFLVANGFPAAFGLGSANKFIDLTTNLDQARADTAVTDTDNFVILEMLTRDISDDGQNNSWYVLVANDHLFGGNAQRS